MVVLGGGAFSYERSTKLVALERILQQTRGAALVASTIPQIDVLDC